MCPWRPAWKRGRSSGPTDTVAAGFPSRKRGSIAVEKPVFRHSAANPVWILMLALVAVLSPIGRSADCSAAGEATQARMTAEIAGGRPVVVHVVVALCDNENQGIIPVPSQLGNGQDPGTNLYWGARYGVKNFFVRQAGWTGLAAGKPADARILERLVLCKRVRRAGAEVPVYVVADAWDGAEIGSAIKRFLDYAGGGPAEAIFFHRDSLPDSLLAGGSAHLVAFVGHNGLMDLTLPVSNQPPQRDVPGSSVVLACASKPYFLERLHAAGSHALLLTTGLMAPEAYTLEAAIRSWAGGGSVADVCEAAAVAYGKYQKCGPRAARHLFWCECP
jgi:hypothetical protein